MLPFQYDYIIGITMMLLEKNTHVYTSQYLEGEHQKYFRLGHGVTFFSFFKAMYRHIQYLQRRSNTIYDLSHDLVASVGSFRERYIFTIRTLMKCVILKVDSVIDTSR